MPLKRGFGFVPNLPNAGSEHQTPASLMLDSHWSQLRLVERWDWIRFVRLCQFLRFTPWELASLVMMRHDSVESYKRTGRIPGHNARSTALILTLLEAHVMKAWTTDIIESPFPTLVAMEPSPEQSPDAQPSLGAEMTSHS